MSDNGSVDYSAVLADLRAKRDRIDAAIAGIEAMLGISALAVQPNKEANTASLEPLGPGAFLGMTIVDATKKYLSHKRQNQRTEEILRALREGGVVLTAESPLNVVGSVLNRNYNSGGDIVRVSRGVWGLAQWHPRLKKRVEKTGSELSSSQAAITTGEDVDVDEGEDNPLA